MEIAVQTVEPYLNLHWNAVILGLQVEKQTDSNYSGKVALSYRADKSE